MNNWVVELSSALNEYNLKAERAAKEAAREAAEVTARQLQSTSPVKAKGKDKGKYKRGWKVKRMDVGTLVSYVVYNGTDPGLTHLLEHGHAVRNQYGSWGRARANKHIAPAAEAGIMRFELGVRARLNKG